MDATTTYRREILEFIAGPVEVAGSDDSQSELRWSCGCSAVGQHDAYRIVPCDEHRPEFDGMEDARPPETPR